MSLIFYFQKQVLACIIFLNIKDRKQHTPFKNIKVLTQTIDKITSLHAKLVSGSRKNVLSFSLEPHKYNK